MHNNKKELHKTRRTQFKKKIFFYRTDEISDVIHLPENYLNDLFKPTYLYFPLFGF